MSDQFIRTKKLDDARLSDMARQCGENRDVSQFWRDAETALHELIDRRALPPPIPSAD